MTAEQSNWKEPAHPSAHVVARESLAAMDRLLGLITQLDEKASYLGAGVVALTVGFIAGVAIKPPSNPFTECMMILAFILYLVAFAAVCAAWWPRTVYVPPHPKGLREHHFNDREENVLRKIADEVATRFDETKRLAACKSRNIQIGLVCLIVATVTSVLVIATSVLHGGSCIG